MSDFRIKGMQGGLAELQNGKNYTKDVKNNGGSEHTAFYRSISPDIERLSQKGSQLIDDLRKQLDECSDPDRRAEIAAAIDDLESALRKMQFQPPGGGNSFSDFASHWETYLNRVDDAVRVAENIKLGIPQDGSDDDVAIFAPQGQAVDMSGRTEAGRAKTEGKSVDESGAADSTGKSREAGDSEPTGKIGDMTPDEMINKITDDPEAVSEYIQSLDPMDQQVAMASMQERMNEINQMFSMMTNIAKAQHDTAKAAINNMRV